MVSGNFVRVVVSCCGSRILCITRALFSDGKDSRPMTSGTAYLQTSMRINDFCGAGHALKSMIKWWHYIMAVVFLTFTLKTMLRNSFKSSSETMGGRTCLQHGLFVNGEA